MDLSLEALKEAVAIREQIDKLEARLAGIFGGAATSAKPPTTSRRSRGMSAEARARISAAAKARWAARRAKQSAPATGAKTQGRGITAAGRKRLSEMMKARWAARKKGSIAKR